MLAANSPAFKPGMKRDSNNDFPQIISNSPLFRAGKLNKVFILAAVIMLTSRAGPILAQERPDKKRMPSLSPHHAHGPDVPRMAPDEVLIKFRENFTLEIQEQFQTQVKVKAASREQAVAAFHAFHRTRARGKVLFGWQRVTLPAGKGVSYAMEEYKQNALVEAVEPNYKAYAAEVSSTTYTARGWINDPYYSDGQTQWWLDRTKGDEAMNPAHAFAFSGATIIVAVLDTGADLDHPELIERLVSGYNVLIPGNLPEDNNVARLGHGTHVTGMIIAKANNNLGVAGTANKSNIKVMPIKVLDANASGFVSDIATGINEAVNRGANIINLSLVVYGYSSVMASACADAAGQGCLLVASAGNDNRSFSEYPYYPAGDPNVMAIAATDSEDYATWYTNGGSVIDLAAPGGSFAGYTDHGVTCTAMDAGFSALEGTSFSAPQVSALAALLWLQDPSRTANTLRTLMTSHCENPQSVNPFWIGAGRINILESLKVWQTPTITPTITPTSTITQTFTITPTSTITPTATPTPTITVTFTITPTATITSTSTPLVLTREEIRVSPQPGRDYVRVAFNFQGQGRVSLDLYTVAGERVIHLEERPQEQAGSAIVEIATKKVSPGVYYLHIQVQDSQGKRQLKGKVAIVK